MLALPLASEVSRIIRDFIRTHSFTRSGWQVAYQDPRGRITVQSLHPSRDAARREQRAIIRYVDGPVWIEELKPLLRQRAS